jgi:hypothetical protein
MTDATHTRPGERFFVWVLLAFSVCILVTALRIPHLENLSSSGAFPILTAAIMISMAACVLWRNRRRYAALTLQEEFRQVRAFAVPRNVVGYALILLLYILTTASLHFLPSSFTFLVVSFMFLKAASPLRSGLIAAGTLAGMYVLFQTVFKVVLW